MDILADPKFKYFIQQKSRKPKTIERYILQLGYYIDCTGKTLTELIREAREDQTKYQWMDERRIPFYFDDFINYLNDKPFTDYSKRNIISTVKAFYHTFEIKTPQRTIKGVPESNYLSYEELPQYNDFKKLITISNTLYRALFTFMASSGMNYADATNITIYDLLKSVNHYFKITKQKSKVNSLTSLHEVMENSEEIIIPTWRMWRLKTGQHHLTFSSPESLEFILNYLDHRPPQGDDSPLFRKGRTDEKIKYKAVGTYLRYQNQQLGWEDKHIGTFHYVTSKSFRTFFANELDDEGLDYRQIRLMMGHRMPGVDPNYFKNNAPKLLETYKKGLHRLTFIKTVDTVEVKSEEYKVLEAELKRRDERDQARDEEVKTLTDKNKRLVEDVEVLKAIARRQGQLPKK